MAHWTGAPRRIGFADAREGGRWGLTERVEIPEGTHVWIGCWVCCRLSASRPKRRSRSFRLPPTAKPSGGGKPDH